MSWARRISIAIIAVIVVPAMTGLSIDVNDTVMLREPAISERNIAFVYANDLWVSNLDGSGVRRLTSDIGVESNPAFSPDGKLIAFSAQYDGNVDVYVVPAEGGVPTRLTWHPGQDIVQGFKPDGSAVLFSSTRAVSNNRYSQLFTAPVAGGFAEARPIPNASKGEYSPDGARVAYVPLPEAFLEWKGYRGGEVSTISIFRNSDYRFDKVPQPQGGCNDTDPTWIGDTLYFRSDRNGEFNVFSFDTKSKAIKQLTNHNDFPVLAAKAGGGRIVYEQAGKIHVLDPAKGRSAPLKIGVAADLVETRQRYVKGFRYLRWARPSPTGARVVADFRGEIVTAPAEKGDVRNLTNTTSAHERFPIWSPDGKSIAYFSDESGEYELHVRNQDGSGDVRRFKLNGAGFYDTPSWSPDSQKIAYADNSWSLFWIDLKTGESRKIGSEPLYGPSRDQTVPHAWSPDSKWIAYTLNTKASIQTVYAYSLETGKSSQVSDGLSEVSEPAFDRSGKYLYFLASTDAGPAKDWFALSNAGVHSTQSIYIAVLRKDLPSPLAKENDEEKGTAEKDAKAADSASAAPAAVSIDFDGLNNRILAMPIPSRNYWNLQTGAAGQLYFLEDISVIGADSNAPHGALHHYDLNTRKDEVLFPDISSFELTADGKKILYGAGETLGIVAANVKSQVGAGKMNLDAIEVRVDPRAEWKQIFDEAWRINRDYFYAPNMHGADWKAMKAKYVAFLPHVAVRSDLNRVIQWMSSELGVGHHRVNGGDTVFPPKNIPGGLLGADYSVENGRYRFKKVYGGLNWNPGLRSPLTEPGVNVRAGEYLLAVRGQDLRPPTELYSLFENTANKITDITVGPNTDGTGSRTVQVVPVANEQALRNREWVETNLKKVEEATGGRVAYVYVPNTSSAGYDYFKRYFYPQAYKDAIIVDERFNSGGQVADYYIDILRRPFVSNWATRYGEDLKSPAASIQGPKVMIIDETAGSGGDLLPWMFRKFQLGTIVGKRTWGGLVGTLGFPLLMDGGGVTAPNLAIWTEDGWVVENAGVPPDIEVEQTPADVIAGHDPQLERAIQVALDQLKKSPPKQLTRPEYPVKTRRP